MEMSRLKDQLVEMVESVASADVGKKSPSRPSTHRQRTHTLSSGPAESYVDNPTLLIGSSTGGPKMVEQVMAELPRGADFRVLVVQHMPDGFTGRFAERIDANSDYGVREARDGDRLGGGEALVAPGDSHLEVSNYHAGRLRVSVTDDPPVNSVRPSVDVTMETAAETVTDPIVGVILTGMGEDGAAGIEAIKAVDGHTISQNEETSAVFGMPKRAIETGHVDDVLPIGEIPGRILDTATAEVT